MTLMTLRDRLADWTDFDGAAYELGVVLGLFPKEFGVDGDLWHGTKGIFWSANPLGDALSEVLESLCRAGVLEKDEDHRYRWNSAYEVSTDSLDPRTRAAQSLERAGFVRSIAPLEPLDIPDGHYRGVQLKPPTPLQFPALPRNDYPADPPTPTLDESPAADQALDVEQLASLRDPQ